MTASSAVNLLIRASLRLVRRLDGKPVDPQHVARAWSAVPGSLSNKLDVFHCPFRLAANAADLDPLGFGVGRSPASQRSRVRTSPQSNRRGQWSSNGANLVQKGLKSENKKRGTCSISMLGLCASIVKLSNPPMPNNVNSDAAWNCHEAASIPATSVRTNPHFLDFGNQPLPFKIYQHWSRRACPARCAKLRSPPSLQSPVASPPIPPRPSTSARFGGRSSAPVPFRQVSPGRGKYSGGEVCFRAAACTRRSTRLRNTWSAATSRVRQFKPASITSLPPSLACAGCVPEIIAAYWSRPPAVNLLSLTHR